MQTSEISIDTFSNHFPQHGMTVSEGRPRRACREVVPQGNPVDDDLMTKIALGDIQAAERFKVRHQASRRSRSTSSKTTSKPSASPKARSKTPAATGRRSAATSRGGSGCWCAAEPGRDGASCSGATRERRYLSDTCFASSRIENPYRTRANQSEPERTRKNVNAMTTKKSATKTSETTTQTHEEDDMTTKKTAAHAATAAPAPATTAVAVASGAPPLIFLQPPPADAKIPVAPSGAAQPNASNYRSVIPKTTELAALPAAVENLKRFTNFAQVFALSGLPYAQVLQAFDVGNQWSTMRKATAAWDAFSMMEEGLAWGTIRSLMDRLGPLWDIATAADPSLAATNPALATLFSAKKAIAQKAVSTKKLNKEAIARGEEPTHGVVGKRRQKKAQKALAAAAKAAGLTTTPAVASSPAPAGASPPTAAPAASAASAPGTTTTGHCSRFAGSASSRE